MTTPAAQPTGGAGGAVRIDAALRQTVALLELVSQEEALLGLLHDCVTQLQAVHRARQHLLDVTDAELSEADQLSRNADRDFTASPSPEVVGP